MAAGLAAAPVFAAAPDISPDAMVREHLWRELVSRPPERRPKVGLVLSAGSIRGVAHVGVIQVLEQAGFPIDMVAGTSMGAVFGGLYAAGRPLKRLREIAEGLTVRTGTNVDTVHVLSMLLTESLFSSENTEKLIRAEIKGLRFDQLAKPFACPAMDIYTGENIIFREGDVASAVRASMNLPGIFEPVQYRHRFLVDGGVVDYIPIDAAKLLGADWILASVTESDYRSVRPKNVLETLEQVIDIRGTFLSREQRKSANVVIEPPVGDVSMRDTERIPEVLSKGVIAAYKAVIPAQEDLILFSLKSLLPDWQPRAGARK